MKTGRNDPCPCGSGKKYKKCCIHKAVIPAETVHYRRLSEAHDRLIERMSDFAERKIGGPAMSLALNEFMNWPETDEGFDSDEIERIAPIFWPWFLFNWEYEADAEDDPEFQLDLPEETTIAEMFREARGAKLDSLELRVLDAINREPYSFWDVRHVEKRQGMTLHDMLRDFQINVVERAGSEFLRPGDAIFGRAVGMDGVGMLFGLGPSMIPPDRKPHIIQLRKFLQQSESPITNDTLWEHDIEIRDLYYQLAHAQHTPPRMTNTDGDPLEFHKLVFEVASADEAFTKLQTLCATQSPEELSADAERDASGRVTRAEIPWDRSGHKASAALPNTLLGHIRIQGRRITAEVNSAERAATLRHEIETRLGTAARFKLDEIQDMEAMMASMNAGGPGAPQSAAEQEALMQMPEVQDQLKQFITQHWTTWVDHPLPALGGLTPREAVKTKEGRESVDALLQSAERADGTDPLTARANREGTRLAREILGLKPQEE